MEKNKKIIVAHSGSFHADDIFAVATLQLLLEKEYSTEVIRTRDRDIINSADYVVDVGDMYDPETNRFDHHQGGGAGVRANGIPYASFGLVWKKYGEVVSGSPEVAEMVDQRLVQPIDAMDNGIDFMKTEREGLYMYDVKDITMIYRATWSEEESVLEENFKYLTSFFKELLKRQIFVLKDIKAGEEHLTEIINKNKDKTLLILDKHYDYEVLMSRYPDILLVVFPKRQDGTWSVETVRNDTRSYVARIDLPVEWAGKRDAELVAVTGVKDAIFCHQGRFIAVAGSKEGAIELARKALENVGK